MNVLVHDFERPLRLKDVKYIPESPKSILAQNKFDHSCYIISADGFLTARLKLTGAIVFVAKKSRDGMYYLMQPDRSKAYAYTNSTSVHFCRREESTQK